MNCIMYGYEVYYSLKYVFIQYYFLTAMEIYYYFDTIKIKLKNYIIALSTPSTVYFTVIRSLPKAVTLFLSTKFNHQMVAIVYLKGNILL